MSDFAAPLPLMRVHPYCPRCGGAAMFMARQSYPGQFVPIRCGNDACGWSGRGPEMIPIPTKETT